MPMHWEEKFLPVSVFFLFFFFFNSFYLQWKATKKHFMHSNFQTVKNIGVEILWRLDLETEIMS